MNENKSINSLKKQLVAAVAMVLVAAVALGSSTYAWFAMNTQVEAKGMQVTAVAEDGIVIANVDKSDWKGVSTAKVTTANLIPTSTAGTKTPTFVHASSDIANDAKASQDVDNYTDLSLKYTNSTYGEGFVDIDGGTANTKDASEKTYVLLNEFYIKASGDPLTLGADKTYKDLYINDVTVTSDGFKAIDNALRVLVVVGDSAYIYAPVINQDRGVTTLSYRFKNTTDVSALNATVAAGYDKATSTTSIGNTDATAVKAQVYIYFEGEDANCKSTNISGVDVKPISVSVKFGIKTTH